MLHVMIGIHLITAWNSFAELDWTTLLLVRQEGLERQHLAEVNTFPAARPAPPAGDASHHPTPRLLLQRPGKVSTAPISPSNRFSFPPLFLGCWPVCGGRTAPGCSPAVSALGAGAPVMAMMRPEPGRHPSNNSKNSCATLSGSCCAFALWRIQIALFSAP